MRRLVPKDEVMTESDTVAELALHLVVCSFK